MSDIDMRYQDMNLRKHAFLFDVDDTIYDQLLPFMEAYEKSRRYNSLLSVEQLYKTFRKYSDEVFYKTENGEMKLNDMYIYRITRAFGDYGIMVDADEALKFQDDYVISQKGIKLFPGIIDTFDYCKTHHIPIGIITNGPVSHQKNKMNQLGISKWIDPENIFISSEIGTAKPDVRIFRLAEGRMKLNQEYTYFVGDSFANDIVGAANAGWKTIWCNRRQHIPFASDIKPDFIIDNPYSLLEIVKNIIE